MRLAEAPVTVLDFLNPSLTSGGASGFGRVRASATSTSPLGNTCSQRGLSNPSAKRVTVNPEGAAGILPSGQPITLENFTADGVALGEGSFGWAGGSAADADAITASAKARMARVMERSSMELCHGSMSA